MEHNLATQLRNASIGDIITFGTYSQTAEGTDKTPITWRILEQADTGFLMLSEHLLDCKQYHGRYGDVTWQNSDLRRWLNNDFYQTAFTNMEKNAIQTTLCTGHGTNSPDTQDRVFLLNIAEVNRLTDALGKDFRRARGTAYAKIPKADGCHLYVMDKNVDADYMVVDGAKQGCSWWWLRDQGKLKDKGDDPSRAVFIGTRASIRHYARVDLTAYGVRPALHIHL